MKDQYIFPLRNLIVFALLFNLPVFAQSLLWPTDASRLLTSSFGEYRSRHFHSGIDIKTWGKEGYQVFAIGSGSVIRLRVSPYNYGKAVYFKLDNGLLIVLGHLSEFTTKLRPFVEEAQRKKNRYQTDISFPEGMIPFEAGEVLAYSGGTGIGAPHLHMEVRDQNNCPINPLFAGYTVKDNLPPILRSLGVRPLSAGSHVNGDVKPVLMPPYKLSDTHYILTDTLSCLGDIGFSLSCFDQANGASNKLAVYKLALFVDDHPVYSTQFDRIPFEKTRQVDLDRDYVLRKQGLGTYQKLYRDMGNSLQISWPAYSEAGVVHCSVSGSQNDDESIGNVFQSGLHRLTILASDYSGNETRLAGWFKVEEQYSNNPYQTINTQPDSVQIFKEFTGPWIRFEMRSPVELPQNSNVWIWPVNDTPIRLDMILKSSGVYSTAFPAQNLQSGFVVLNYIYQDQYGREQVIKENLHLFNIPTSGGTMISEDEIFKIRFPSDGLYEPVSCTIEQKYSAKHEKQYTVVPDIPLKRSAKIQMKIAAFDSLVSNQMGIYSVNGNGNFYFAGNMLKDGWLSANVNSLSTYQIMQDSVAPEILWIFPVSGTRLLNRKLTLQFCFKDTLSGIRGEENYQYFLDGHPLIVAFDPDKDTGTCLLWEPLSYGRHEFLIRVKDRAGNVNEEKGFFIIG